MNLLSVYYIMTGKRSHDEQGDKSMKKFSLILFILMLVLTGCKEKKGAEVEQIEALETLGQIEIVVPEIIDITISAAGDVTMGNYIGQGYENSFNQTYEKQEDKSYFFQNVYDIFREDDLTLVNLEGVLTTSDEAAPGRDFSIKGKPEYVSILTLGDIEAVSMENNHRRDFGVQGTTDTVEALESENIAYAYEDILGMYEVKGVKIGWIAVNHASFGSSVEGLLENGIKKLNEEADIVLACCHWGIERQNYPTDAQRELGKKCIDWGADLVIGHHPHVIQGFEEYQGKYIVYSLGNFCFGANKNPDDKDSMIFQQTFHFMKTIDENGEEIIEMTGVGEAKAIPCSISSVKNRNDYCPTPLTGEEGQRVIGRLNQYSNDYGVTIDENGILHSH